MEIGLALSGGGFRATVFHLGLLDRLAKENLLETVSFISTVSGGSFCAGLVYSCNNYTWPTSSEYRQKVVPAVRNLLTQTSIRIPLILKTLSSPYTLLDRRANIFSQVIKAIWHIDANLSDIPNHPRWISNGVCYETGKNWRFMSKRMGDYSFGYVDHPKLPLSDVIAASAAYPFFIGPLVLDTSEFSWSRYTDEKSDEQEPITIANKILHIWDGGVYDNLGLEALFKIGEGFRDGFDFLIVSDASGANPVLKYRQYQTLRRLVTLAVGQNQSLYTRHAMAYLIENHYSGAYLRLGHSAPYILKQANRAVENPDLGDDCLHDSEIALAANMQTTIRRLSEEEFELLFQHGFETANFTLHGYLPDKFPLLNYDHLLRTTAKSV